MNKLIFISAMLFSLFGNAQFRLVKDINLNSTYSFPRSFYEYNGRLFFRATIAGVNKIFTTNGTTVGTIPLDFSGNVNGVINDNLTIGFYQYNSELFFDSKSSAIGNMNVVKIMGNASTALPVSNIAFVTGDTNSRFIGAAGISSKLIYNSITNSSLDGLEPMVIDLSVPSSGVLKNINAPTSASSIYSSDKFTVLGSDCFFTANDGVNGREIWKTDGTPAGTALYLDLNSGTTDSNPDEYNVLGNQLIFAATHPTLGREFFKTNGSGSLVLLNDINPSGDSNPLNSKLIGGILYFSANNGTNGYELWKSNGNSLGTVLVKDINPTGNSNPSNFTLVGTDVYFTANDGSTSIEIWKTDGTNSGTVLVKNISISGTISELTAYNGKLYFVTRPSDNEDRIWISDGTSAGTTQLSSATLGKGGLIVFSNELYMPLNTFNGVGEELYAYMDPALAKNEFQLNDKTITLFPNPSKNYFELSSNVSIEKVEIYSIQGQLVKSFKNENQYAISDLAKGIYIVKINATQGNLNKTLIVE